MSLDLDTRAWTRVETAHTREPGTFLGYDRGGKAKVSFDVDPAQVVSVAPDQLRELR